MTLRLLNFVFQFLRFRLWRHHSPQPTSKKCRIQYSYPAVHSVPSCNKWCLYIFLVTTLQIATYFSPYNGTKHKRATCRYMPKTISSKTKWMFPKIVGTPQIIHFNRVFHGYPLFLETPQMSKGGFQNDGVLNFSYFSLPGFVCFKAPPHDWTALQRKNHSQYRTWQGNMSSSKVENHWDVSPTPANGKWEPSKICGKSQTAGTWNRFEEKNSRDGIIHHGKSSSSCIGIQIRSFCPGIVQNRKPSGSQYV